MKNKDQITDKINNLEQQIAELKILIQQLLLNNNKPINNNNVCPVDGKEHQYPLTWHAVIPPYCKKCGKQANNVDVFWDCKTSDAAGWDFEKFGGNIMNSDSYKSNGDTFDQSGL